jgi:ATP-dependent RNA helicase SUPV3L1/SUV3
MITWKGEGAGRLIGGRPFAPKAALFGALGPLPARERARRRLEAYLAGEASRLLLPFKRIEDALAGGELKGLARGLVYRLAEAGGVLPRREVGVEVKALSQAERRALRSLGVRFGAFALFLPAVQTPAAQTLLRAFARIEAPNWRPPADRPSQTPHPSPSPLALGWCGVVACGGLVVPIATLERLDGLIRAAPRKSGGAVLADADLERLGWSVAEARGVLKALGYTPVKRAADGEPTIWRQRQPRPAPPPIAATPAPVDSTSPFAALSALTPPPKAARRPRRRPRKPRSKAAA